MELWTWFIRWWLGDEQQFGASMKARPTTTISKTLVVLALFLVGVWIMAFVSQKASNYAEKNSATITTQVIDSKPPFWISYKKISEQPDNSLVKTFYEISIVRVAGNDQKEPKIVNGENLKQADCTEQKWSGTVSFSTGARFLYEVTTYTVDCISERQIVDNKHLFGLEYNYVEKEVPKPTP